MKGGEVGTSGLEKKKKKKKWERKKGKPLPRAPSPSLPLSSFPQYAHRPPVNVGFAPRYVEAKFSGVHSIKLVYKRRRKKEGKKNERGKGEQAS